MLQSFSCSRLQPLVNRFHTVVPADINTPPNYAFEQRSPRQFFMLDVEDNPVEDGCELTLYKFPQLEYVGKTRTVSHAVRFRAYHCHCCPAVHRQAGQAQQPCTSDCSIPTTPGISPAAGSQSLQYSP